MNKDTMIPEFYTIKDKVFISKKGLVELINHHGFKISFRNSKSSVIVKITKNGISTSIKVTGEEPELKDNKAMAISKINTMRHYGIKKIADEYLQDIMQDAILEINKIISSINN